MKKAIKRTALLLVLVALSMSTMAIPSGQENQDFFGSKRETMKNVLEALEDGRDYDSMPYWRENQYGFPHFDFDIPDFDFDWDFPDIEINEEFLEDLEKKLEIMEKRIQEKLQELEKKIDSLKEEL